MYIEGFEGIWYNPAMKRTYLEKHWKTFEAVLLAVILAFTFLLSIKQLYPLDSFDEVEMMNWAKGLEVDFFPALKFPPLFLYMQYILSWLYRLILSFTGIIGGTAGFLETEFGFRFTMEAGRVVNAAIASFTVYMIYKTGKTFYNTGTALAAAVLTGLNGLVILYAHIFRPDIPVMFLLTMSAYYLLHYLRGGANRRLFLAAMFCGLAVAGKFNVFPVVPALALAVLFKVKFKSKALKPILLYLPTGALAGFFMGAPNWLFNPLGNIGKFFMQYSPDSGQIYQTYMLTSPLKTLGDIMADLGAYFGPVCMVLLLLGVIAAFLLKRKGDITIVAMVLPYYLLFALFGFYASRYGLPPYPLLALLMAKFLFMDLGVLVKKWGGEKWGGALSAKSTLAATLAVSLLLAFWGGDRVIHSIKNYNLLKTRLLFDATRQYREEHNITAPDNNIGRQIYTPKVRGRNFKLTKRFYQKGPIWKSAKRIHFVQAHLPTWEDYMKNPAWRAEPRAMNLDAYRPFYRVRKREYQPWNPEAVFLYPIRPELAALDAPEPSANPDLPRLFYSSEHTTFLPLQTYQKNPSFYKIEGAKGGVWGHWLYSTRPLRNLACHVFSLRRQYSFRLLVNGRQKLVKKLKGGMVQRLETGKIKPEGFHYDYVYRVEIERERGPLYLVMEPVYTSGAETGAKAPLAAEALNGDIPALFSRQPVPGWVKRYYVRTGIDLLLLTYLNTVRLYGNDSRNTADISPDIFPLPRGSYILRLQGGPIVPSHVTGESAVLKLTRWTDGDKRQRQYSIKGPMPLDIPIRIDKPLEFIKIAIKDLRQNNILIEGISLIPDYRRVLSGK